LRSPSASGGWPRRIEACITLAATIDRRNSASARSGRTCRNNWGNSSAPGALASGHFTRQITKHQLPVWRLSVCPEGHAHVGKCCSTQHESRRGPLSLHMIGRPQLSSVSRSLDDWAGRKSEACSAGSGPRRQACKCFGDRSEGRFQTGKRREDHTCWQEAWRYETKGTDLDWCKSLRVPPRISVRPWLGSVTIFVTSAGESQFTASAEGTSQLARNAVPSCCIKRNQRSNCEGATWVLIGSCA
jgi:hypothetical protein